MKTTHSHNIFKLLTLDIERKILRAGKGKGCQRKTIRLTATFWIEIMEARIE